MDNDAMRLIKILIYLQYTLTAVSVYLLISVVLQVLPALYYPGIHGEGAFAFFFVIITLSAALYVNSIAIHRLKEKNK